MSADSWMDKQPIYSVLPDGGFVIEDYSVAHPFSSFFPGIAGPYGIPLWVFYVNRGQGIVSMGIGGKDGAILEFFPANKAYQNVSRYGFRTFIKFRRETDFLFYEPFQDTLLSKTQAVKQKMTIYPYELEIEEINKTLGLKVTATYFTLPQEPIAALVRVLSIRNLNSNKPVNLEVLDGLPVILPYGLNQFVVKNMSRTAEAWMQAKHIDDKLGFYKVKVELDDRPEVVKVEKGNFYFSLISNQKGLDLISIISDPETIFGSILDFNYPNEFLRDRNYIYPEEQFLENKTPCAFSFRRVKIPPSGEVEIISFIGHISSEKELKKFANYVASNPNFIIEKRKQNRSLIEDLTKDIFTVSGFVEFDKYTAQSYLDNMLRGGYPILLKKLDGFHIFYVYGRKHGDLERDYNNFYLDPTFFSQGNGNYRDMNQNRRLDVIFHPEIGDVNIKLFMNLLQLDGYNPLQINGIRFVLRQSREDLISWLKDFVGEKCREVLADFLITKEFAPGELFKFIKEHSIKIKGGADRFLVKLLSYCEKIEDADHREGFWTDHWSYNLDLIESYLSIYPDREQNLFFEDKTYSFYDNAHYVAKREDKYVLTEYGVRQYGSVRFSEEKAKLIDSRTNYKNRVRMLYGKGQVYYTNLAVKLLSLLAVKVMNLDPFGVGIEMEADKPNWYDSLNGLPGLFGSSSAETIEILRLIVFLERLFSNYKEQIGSLSLPVELADLMQQQREVLFSETDTFKYWQEEGKLKEDFRDKVFWGVSGEEKSIGLVWLLDYLKEVKDVFSKAVERAKDKKTGLIMTYFYYNVEDYEVIKDKIHPSGGSCVRVKKFSQHVLPLFLEGQVHYLRIVEDKKEAVRIYEAVKKSSLFDTELSMYKVCASLKGESLEIGRSAVFSPGWLENESIWLHMEYKYLLELLKRGIGKNFYTDLLKVAICFQKPEVYGRSILENSSFLVSSAFPDPSQWGRGFVARLTGSTVEWMNIWHLLCVGQKMFYINEEGVLCFEFSPQLPEWLFTTEAKKIAGKGTLSANSFMFTLLGKTLVVYHNPKRYNCFSDGVGVKELTLITARKEQKITVKGGVLKSELADLLRSGGIKEIVGEIDKIG